MPTTQTLPIFATHLSEEALELNNEEIVEWVHSLRAKSVGERPGGWQSPWIDFASPPIHDLVAHVRAHLTYLSEEIYGFKKDVGLKLANGWINCNDPGLEQLNNNYYHLHTSCFTSMVYYVDCAPDSGDLVLIPPHQMVDYALPFQLVEKFNIFNSQRWRVSPLPGKLVSFPAWVNHFADPNRSDRERISIAFNAILDVKTNNLT